MYSADQLNAIYDRTSGYCHLCHKKLAFNNYAAFGQRGAWEVEHSSARANGGSNHGNNLYAACISCNRSKGTQSTRRARAQRGKTRAPLSATRRKQAQVEQAVAGAFAGALLGAKLGPVGMLAGALIGATKGSQMNPDKLR